MSKRFHPREYGERKKPKLDVSLSNHKFPLSQNRNVNNAEEENNWGNEDDDEILLLASQACEDAQNVSLLPDYSLCMQPPSTSTQYDEPGPSKYPEFTFKKPTQTTSSIVSTNLKEKCTRISSPLPGITSKLMKNNNNLNFSSDLIFNDELFDKHDSESICRQLLQIKEENAKLKLENGKLMDKCVTKEGEASILRTQLRSLQVAVDNARLEKIKGQEKIQMEWTERLDKINRKMSDLTTQLDFKNSEIIGIKEKCKILESSKVRLTQVTVANNDISSSHKLNSSILQKNSNVQSKRIKTASSAVQTVDKTHFFKLNLTQHIETTQLTSILPHILQATPNQQYSILEYNEKLQNHTDLSQYKCRVYSTFHRIPATPSPKGDKLSGVDMGSIYEDVSSIAIGCNDVKERCFRVFNTIRSVLIEVNSRLEKISQRISPAFQKEMDEKYIDATSRYMDVRKEDLLKGIILFKEEQEILARRMTAVMAYILEYYKHKKLLEQYEEQCIEKNRGKLIDLLARICSLIDNTSCATMYSGLLLAINIAIGVAISCTSNVVVEILKSSITSRPVSFVCCHLLKHMVCLSREGSFRKVFCSENGGNLKTDYEQGVLLYRKDSCYIQILIRQIETYLKCIEDHNISGRASEITRNLILLHNNINYERLNLSQRKNKCDCHLVLTQITVYALRICSVMLRNILDKTKGISKNSCTFEELLAVCRSGIQLVYKSALRDAEFSSQLLHNEGHLIEFCEIMKELDHSEIHSTMLSDIAGTLQSSVEETTPSLNKQVWFESFNNFTISD